MKRIYIRGFHDGEKIQFRIYDNSEDFERNWDRGIGTYSGLDKCSHAITEFGEEVQLVGFDIPEADDRAVKTFRNYLERVIEDYNSDFVGKDL